MARKVLVSLVSEQTIPNVELIKEFQNIIEKYIFISTLQMEKQLNWILEASGITSEEYDKIVVNAFDTSDIEKKINDYDFGDDEIILNITGGTKLMSLIVNDIFKNLGCTIYYLTGHKKSYIKVFPGRGESLFQLQYKLTLREYLTAYGFEYKQTKPYKDFETAERIFEEYITLDKTELKLIFEPIRIRRKRNMEVDESIDDFLQRVKYIFDNKLNKEDTKYLSGDWLEEYIYYWVKNELELDEDEIATGLNLIKEGIQNEIDVVFIYNHKLFIIECKTSIIDKRMIKRIRGGKEVEEEKEINLLSEIIYKSDALRGKFGLFANTSIFTLEEIKEENGNPKDGYEQHFNRAELSRIKIVSRRDILSGKSLKEILGIN